MNLSKGRHNFLQLVLVTALLILLSACSEPTGMDAPFSSATTEAYNESMKTLEGLVTASEYQQLKRSINYLNMNSTEFAGLDEFRNSLNGSTATKIIKRADALKTSKQKAAAG
ncbi:MAG: hypothetical protein IMF09_04425 [Proteobacteria bacterium]|nr:hypothetical protein [Pseudomonadota bacterium]